MLSKVWLIAPVSRFSGPASSGVSTNVSCGHSFMSIATRCFDASGPAAATDASTTAAASATITRCGIFTVSSFRASLSRPELAVRENRPKVDVALDGARSVEEVCQDVVALPPHASTYTGRSDAELRTAPFEPCIVERLGKPASLFGRHR